MPLHLFCFLGEMGKYYIVRKLAMYIILSSNNNLKSINMPMNEYNMVQTGSIKNKNALVS